MVSLADRLFEIPTSHLMIKSIDSMLQSSVATYYGLDEEVFPLLVWLIRELIVAELEIQGDGLSRDDDP